MLFHDTQTYEEPDTFRLSPQPVYWIQDCWDYDDIDDFEAEQETWSCDVHNSRQSEAHGISLVDDRLVIYVPYHYYSDGDFGSDPMIDFPLASLERALKWLKEKVGTP